MLAAERCYVCILALQPHTPSRFKPKAQGGGSNTPGAFARGMQPSSTQCGALRSPMPNLQAQGGTTLAQLYNHRRDTGKDGT